MDLGIILLDDVYPGCPGDVRNTSVYPFPIQYEVAEDVDIWALVHEEDKSPCLEPILQAAKKLERMGCRPFAVECGYFAHFHREIAEIADVPVFMSSLLQVPLAQQLIGPDKVVDILMAQEAKLLPRHLEAVGILPGTNYVIGRAMDEGHCQEFKNLWYAPTRPNPPQAYYDKAHEDFLEVGVKFFKMHPDRMAIFLKRTGMPPLARAFQREIDIPIFRWGTLLDYAYSVFVHRDYYGHV